MWLSNQINPSKYHIIQRFDLIVAIAKIMRGNHFFYVSKENGAIYGVPEEPYAIREVKLPPGLTPPISFVFRLDTLNAEMVSEYINFALFDDIPWALIPVTDATNMYRYTPIFRPSTGTRLWTIVDKMFKQEIEFLDLYCPDSDKAAPLPYAMQTFRDFFASRNCLSAMPYVFLNMERNVLLQDVFSSKAIYGEKYLDLSYDDKHYGILLFKNLFVFNKNDKLAIEIRDRIDRPGAFEAKFIVTHDKNNIKYIIEGKLVEHTYCTFIHI